MKFSTWLEGRETEPQRQAYWQGQQQNIMRKWNDARRRERRKNMTPEEVAREEAMIKKRARAKLTP